MIVGECICIAGTALLTQLDIATPTIKWAAYLVVSGIGMGIAMQLPYTAVQVTLLLVSHPSTCYLSSLTFCRDQDIATGNGKNNLYDHQIFTNALSYCCSLLSTRRV